MKFDYGIIALFFAIPAFLPQVIKLYIDNHTESFSKSTVTLFWLAQLFWIIHGIQRKDLIMLLGKNRINRLKKGRLQPSLKVMFAHN